MRRALAQRLRPRFNSSLLAERHPGRPRLLFVGLAESTHTHAWIDLLDGAAFNVLLFALPSGAPPDAWEVPSLVTMPQPPALRPENRQALYPRHRLAQLAHRTTLDVLAGQVHGLEERWLAELIDTWRPDVVHTLGLDPAGYFYRRVRREHPAASRPVWLCQLRGGSDLELNRLDPGVAPLIADAFADVDWVLTDSERNFGFAETLGLDPAKVTELRTVPGTGGVDVDALASATTRRTSERRDILWPKGYESAWSKAMPVLDALVAVWDRIQPARLHVLASAPETRQWFRTLPQSLQQGALLEERLPRARALELLVDSRVLLAPSLVDGTPNSLFEAMAAGALPIVSPIPNIAAIVEEETNVLFARNLYPDEIAAALLRAMSDDALVDAAAERNLARVRELADRAAIRPKVVALYERLAAARSVS